MIEHEQAESDQAMVQVVSHSSADKLAAVAIESASGHIAQVSWLLTNLHNLRALFKMVCTGSEFLKISPKAPACHS